MNAEEKKMEQNPQYHYHKEEPIWWNLSLSQSRPPSAPKGREQQAGWIKDVDYSTQTAIISVMDDVRGYEMYAVPLHLIRPRRIT